MSLDYTLSQFVRDVMIVDDGEILWLIVFCKGLCEASVLKARKKSALLREITGREIGFKIVHPSSL